MDLLKKLETDSEYLCAINSLSELHIKRITNLSITDVRLLKSTAYLIKLNK